MPSFAYVAIEKNGREINGSIEAENREKADSKLRSQGMIPIELKEQNVLQKDIKLGGKKVKPRDLSIFCRQFVSMLKAGVSIVDALEMLQQQTENKTLSEAVGNMRTEIGKGATLSEAMRLQKKAFPEMLVNMVEAGEASGSIEDSIDRMALQFEKSSKMSGLIKKSMMYPMVLLAVTVIIIIVMIVVIIPSYTEMFDELGTEMPLLTQMILNMSDFIMNHYILLTAAIVAIGFGFVKWKETESGKVALGTLATKIPVVKDLNLKTYSATFARTLSTMIRSGVPMIDAIDNVAHTMNNILVKRELLKAKEEVAKGAPLSRQLQQSAYFPPMVTHMLAIGEETGNIDEMLDRAAEYYEEEVETATQSVVALMEPMIIVVMAGIVLIMVLAILMPMLAMYDSIG